MAATERTPLTRPTDSPNYVQFSNMLRTRNTRVRHFQCCICASLLALFMMALVVTISYSVSRVSDDTNVTVLPESSLNLLQSTWIVSSPQNDDEDQVTSVLTDNEWKRGLSAGHDAIRERETADAEATPLVNPSPNSRHQFAVSTSVFAGQLALAGLAEIAATRTIEIGRLLLGQKSSIGAYFDGGWAPDGSCKEFANLLCTRNKYRTFDGTCNHRRQWGSAFTAFRRSLPPEYSDRLNSPRGGKFGKALPSAREVSLRVHPPAPSSNPSFTVMLAVFGQFFDHDITATAISQGCNGSSLACCPPAIGHPECFPVRVGPGDPVYDYTGSTCMEFVRSAPATQCKIGPRQQLNQVSAFIDASVVYGATESAAAELREGIGGRLQMQRTPDNRTLLPPSRNPNDGCNRILENLRGRYCFASGDARANENLHLTTMHLLWARQHNRIADALSAMNPHWDDEKVYQESRRIVGAQLQHITYREFLPVILGENVTNSHNLKPLVKGYRNDYQSKTNPAIANEFAAAAFRFAHTLLPGLMKMTNAAKGTSAYVELHKMLFNPYQLYAPGGVSDIVTSATTNFIQQTSTHVTSQLTRHMFEDPVANTSVPCGLDLVSLNIQRGRDHGLKGYPAWREHCGLSRPTTFSDLKDDLDPDALAEMSKLYASVDDIDLYSGALAEIPNGDGLLGPTFTCLIADQFVRLQRGDRYWYETGETPQAFTEDQLQEIRKTSLAKLICECSDGVTKIQPDVMRAVGPDNPMLSCEAIPSVSLNEWKEDLVMLLMESTASDWVNLKNDINDTIQDIINRVNESRASRAQGWINLHDYMTEIFLRIKIEVDQLNTTLQEQSESWNDENLDDEETVNDVKIFVTESLARTNDHVLSLQNEATVSYDWMNFKRDINESLNSVIQYFRSSIFVPDDTEWLVFKETIRDQFEQLKYQISALKQTIISAKSNNESVPLEGWRDFKKGTNNTIMETAVNGYGSWSSKNHLNGVASFREYVSNSLAVLAAGIDDIQLKPDEEEIETIKTDWLNFKSKINKSLSDAVKFHNKNSQLLNDRGLATSGKEIVNNFADLRVQITSMFANITLKTDESLSSDGLDLKNQEIKLDHADDDKLNSVNEERVKNEDSLNKTLSVIRGNIENIEIKPATPIILATDWVEFKNEINDSMTYFIDILRSRSVEWSSFRTFLNDSFLRVKKDILNIAINYNNLLLNHRRIIFNGSVDIKSVPRIYNLESKFWNTRPSTKIVPKSESLKSEGYGKSFAYPRDNFSYQEFYFQKNKREMPNINSSDKKSQPSVPEWISYKRHVSNGIKELQNLVDAKKQAISGSPSWSLTNNLYSKFYVLATLIFIIN